MRPVKKDPLGGKAARLLAIAGCLWVGAAAAQRVDAPPPWSYTVSPGDTLYDIAAHYLRQPWRWAALQRLNTIDDPRRLRPGRVVHIPFDWLRGDSTVATVAMRVGSVSLQRGGAQLSVDVGDTLHSADELQTGAESSLQIDFVDGSSVLVTPDSRMTLKQLLVLRGSGSASSVLELHDGNAESHVAAPTDANAPRPRFELRMPVMSLGVRGTEFRSGFDAVAQSARTEVTRGRVGARARPGAGETAIAAGYGTVASGGRIEPPRRLPAAPDLSTLPARVETLPLRLAWHGDGAALAWRAQLFDHSEPPQLLKDARVDAPAAQWSDLPDGDYRLHVRAIDAEGLEGYGSDAAFTLKARPQPPFTTAPDADARVYGGSATWRWTLSSAAEHYRLQVAANDDFVDPVIDRDDLTGPTLTASLPPGHWFWRMASVAAGNDQGPWSDPLAFEQRASPPPPKAPTSDLSADKLVLRWSARLPGDSFRLQLARDAEFADLIVDRVEAAPQTQLEPPPPGRYWLRVRTIDGDGEAGPWGAPSQLDVPADTTWWWVTPLLIVLLAL